MEYRQGHWQAIPMAEENKRRSLASFLSGDSSKRKLSSLPQTPNKTTKTVQEPAPSAVISSEANSEVFSSCPKQKIDEQFTLGGFLSSSKLIAVDKSK